MKFLRKCFDLWPFFGSDPSEKKMQIKFSSEDFRVDFFTHEKIPQNNFSRYAIENNYFYTM